VPKHEEASRRGRRHLGFDERSKEQSLVTWTNSLPRHHRSELMPVLSRNLFEPMCVIRGNETHRILHIRNLHVHLCRARAHRSVVELFRHVSQLS